MFFENEILTFQILDVLFMDQDYSKSINHDRHFDALSFRIEADTLIEYVGKEVLVQDNTIGYFPSNVDYTRTAKRDKMIVVNFNTLNFHGDDIEFFVPEDHQKYHSLFEQLLTCWQGKGTAYQYKSASIMNSILAEIYKDNRKNYVNQSKIQPSVKYIEKHYLKSNFSLNEAAAKSFVSPTYFRKLFKVEFGKSPKQYIIERRINYAASLIITGYYSLQEVAELCGYNDYKHFSAEFKRMLGVPPSKYVYKKERRKPE